MEWVRRLIGAAERKLPRPKFRLGRCEYDLVVTRANDHLRRDAGLADDAKGRPLSRRERLEPRHPAL